MSTTLMYQESLPSCVGEKVTLMVQDAPMAKVAGEIGQLLDVEYWLALPPDCNPMEVMLSAAVPVFFKTDVSAVLLEPTLVLGNVIVEGVRVTSGASTPEPLRGTDCGLPVALSVRVTAAVRGPAAVGVKIT